MWSKSILDVKGLPKSANGPSHEQGVCAGPLIFVSGQTAWSGGDIPLEFDAQVRLTFRNIEAVMQAAGATLADLLSMTVFLTDIRHQPTFSRIRREILGSDNLTSSATLAIDKLFDPRALIEIQAIGLRKGFAS